MQLIWNTHPHMGIFEDAGEKDISTHWNHVILLQKKFKMQDSEVKNKVSIGHLCKHFVT